MRVGINNTAPSHKLHVIGSDNSVLRVQGTGSFGSGARFNFGDANYVYIEEDQDDYLHYYSTRRHWFDGSNVGIFTATPSVPLDVFGAGVAGNGTYRARFGWYIGQDPVVAPSNDAWGYCGTSNESWWYVYTYFLNVWSEREKKRDITIVEGTLADMLWEDVESINPYLYKFKAEVDELTVDNSAKYREQLHLGVMVDEVPDYLKDQSLTHLDLYGFTSLTFAGLKHLKKEVDEIKGSGNGVAKVDDFGSVVMNGVELRVVYSSEFTSKLNGATPVVTVTSEDPNVVIAVRAKDSRGFTLVASQSVSGLGIDWLANAKVQVAADSENGSAVDANLVDQLYIPADKAASITEFYKSITPVANDKDFVAPVIPKK